MDTANQAVEGSRRNAARVNPRMPARLPKMLMVYARNGGSDLSSLPIGWQRQVNMAATATKTTGRMTHMGTVFPMRES